MNWTSAFLMFVGFSIGYWAADPSASTKNRFWNQDVQIYGGAFTATPVADVWGYENDWSACQTLAAGANFINSKESEMTSDSWQKFINDWSSKGNTFCMRNE